MFPSNVSRESHKRATKENHSGNAPYVLTDSFCACMIVCSRGAVEGDASSAGEASGSALGEGDGLVFCVAYLEGGPAS